MKLGHRPAAGEAYAQARDIAAALAKADPPNALLRDDVARAKAGVAAAK
jgi:hypothetical protein